MSQSLPKPFEASQDRPTKPPKALQNFAKPAEPSKLGSKLPKAFQYLPKPCKASRNKNKWKIHRKTRDVCARHAFLNEKTRHSHGRDSANTVKMHTKLTSVSEKPVNMHTKKSDALTISGCGLRPKAYRTKRTLGLCPYREKYIKT